MRAKALVAIALAASAAGAAVPAQAGTTKKVTVGDNYFLPMKMTVKKDTLVVWDWPDDAGDVHDVKSQSVPKGAKRFQSGPGAVGYTFKRKLTVPGKYHIICTLHEEMEQDIVVKKPARR